MKLEPTFRAVAARLSGGHDVTYEIMAFDGGAPTSRALQASSTD
jgi:hypothetical protein